MITNDPAIRVSLLFMRLSIFLVMLMWTLDKFINPDHAASVYEHFYFLGSLGPSTMRILGAAELLLLSGFVTGYAKTWTYGFVLIVHAVSTLSAIPIYLSPFESGRLLFFAAWPMLAACTALFLLREHDRIWSMG